MTEKPIHLLLVEDEDALREVTAERLGEHGYQVTQAASGEAALEALADFAFDLVLTDLRLPGIDGTTLIEAAVERYPNIVGLVVTGYGTVKDAVEAIKRGASDFITKPFQFDHLLHLLSSALEQRRLQSENAYLRSQLEERYRFEGIVGRSSSMRRLFDVLETVAATTSTILITGRPERARSWSRARFTTTAPVAGTGSSLSTVAPSRRPSSKPSCSDTSAARSPAPSATARAASSRRTGARSFSTR